MYRNDYEQYIKWQSTGKRAPQPLNEHVRYYFIKKPDWNKIFNKYYSVPTKPRETKKCKSVSNYLILIFSGILEDIFSALGLFFIIVGPILLMDFFILNGVLSICGLVIRYFFYSKKIDIENKYVEKNIKSYRLKRHLLRYNIDSTLEKFKDERFFRLESYSKNRVGKSVPKFFDKLKASGFVGILEAIPKDNPYQLKNGVYSADIGYVDREKGILLDIEIDEKHHFTNFKQWKRDKHRNNYFVERGWTVVRFTEHEIIRNPEHCVNDIVNIISEIENDFDTFSKKQNTLI